MRNKLLLALIGAASTCLTAGPAFAFNTKAMDADIHSIELQWEHIKFEEDGSPNQFAHIDALANFAATLVQKYPGRSEPLIWEGIVTSEEAGMANTLSALGYAKKAKAILEESYQRDPGLACFITGFLASLSASAITIRLGSSWRRPSHSRRTGWTLTISMQTS